MKKVLLEILVFAVVLVALNCLAWLFSLTGTPIEDARTNVALGVVAALLTCEAMRGID